jgi:pimeloyl-ACP methyl ester carboxylesterase
MKQMRLSDDYENNSWFKYYDKDSVMVFVHGVLSSSKTCWLSEGKHDKQVASYWPQIVAQDKRFGGTSIYLGGYHTDIDSGPYEVRNCVDELFSALNRHDGQKRAPMAFEKICFVCHSMGGIVVRSLIERHQDAFANKKTGLVLIASPTFGSEDANSLSWLIDFYNNQQGYHLRWGSWSLEDLDSRFRELLANKKTLSLEGKEFYESRFVLHRKWLPLFRKRTVVTKQAQGRYFGPPVLIPDSDHFSICKPNGKSSLIHQYLYDFLRDKKLLPSKTPIPVLEQNLSHSLATTEVKNSEKVASTKMVEQKSRIAENLLSKFNNYPAVRPHEIPEEVIDIFTKALPTIATATRYTYAVNAFRKQFNPEGHTDDQILILQEEFPLSPSNIIEFWCDVLYLAGGKSRRTLAAFLLAPNAPVPERYGAEAAAIHRNFLDQLMQTNSEADR